MKASEVREMSIADIRERIEIEKANLDTMLCMVSPYPLPHCVALE